ncbi:hypothetical protein EST38_g2860 [Candolleomyces aberdarensis]|uniref:Uncharacterized protein n=1 Tax=Candolleomyces aberdarensis TaxID=2316362 RepID=A0A4Q2DRW6_9AGAR|nr:hypothetical protein EST38_g2860 [Candolleomyces aberdarensis]
MFMDNVLAAGVMGSGLAIGERHDQYLRLYEAMLDSLFEYYATYLRVLTSVVPSKYPSHCLRQVPGEVSYELIGWKVKASQVYFLIPLTIANMVTLGVLVATMTKTWGRPTSHLDPTDTRWVLKATVTEKECPSDDEQSEVEKHLLGPGVVGWEDKVRFSSATHT